MSNIESTLHRTTPTQASRLETENSYFLQALLLAGYDMDLRDAWGHTALHWAAARGHEAATTALLAGKVCVRTVGLILRSRV